MAFDSDADCPPLLLEDEDRDDEAISIENPRFSIWNTFKHHIPRLVITVLVDLICPLVLYLILQKRIKPVYALAAAGIPPFIMVIIKGIVSRTFDALGFLVFFCFVASAIAAVITSSPVILLLEKSLVTGVVSIIFGITLIPFRCCSHRCRIRPLAYYFYQDLVPTKRKDIGLPDSIFEDEQQQLPDNQFSEMQEENLLSLPVLSHKQEVAQVYEWIYRHCSSFRLSCYLITSIWSIGLLLEFLARLFLILIRLSIEKIFIYGHIILSAMTTLLIILTILCITRERKQTLKSIETWKKEYFSTQQSSFVNDSSINIVT
ncbi:unnamed protein product [Rotaria socialis]|uniref:Uncharacterized protein n=1 Tax=Rotaria socialis TaxID=392032 RepID=A0A818NME2_9BILA|nr:unnamed protein product [Rotaria socialis]CAF3607130.1 unnamed protein product [Rotaria socialis]CAF4311713.1 unnamed protein product [Rotaria socialis]CAF4562503.1 unnamed protein product [Rotaria socialis]